MRKGLFMVSAYFLTMMQQRSTSLAFTILTPNITVETYLISFILLPLSWSFLFLCNPNALFSLEILSWWLVCFHCQLLLPVSLMLSFICTLKQRQYVNWEQMISYNKASIALLFVIVTLFHHPTVLTSCKIFRSLLSVGTGDPALFPNCFQSFFPARILIPTSFCQGLCLAWWWYTSFPAGCEKEGQHLWSPVIADIWCWEKRPWGYKVGHLPDLYFLLSFLYSFLGVFQYKVLWQRLKEKKSKGGIYLL